jgi:hypothetical protein
MTRNQFAPKGIKPFSGDPMFTVDGNGNIQPTSTQEVNRGGTILIQADPASTTPYAGYICAWRDGACRCAELITDLGGEPHMKIRATPYHVSATTTPNVSYVMYTTTAPQGSGPSPMESTGDIRVGV